MKNLLKVGATAPIILEKDLWENVVKVPNEKQWVYLSFHRFASCPFCNLRTNELIRNYPKFKEKQIEIITIWPSKKELLLEHSNPDSAVFPILSDPKKHLYKAYGVKESSLKGAIRLLKHPRLIWEALTQSNKKLEIDSDPTLMPASFLIDPNGIIRMAYYGKHYVDHPSVKSILSIP